ncbi:hypothetical protein BYT27DRAFT_6960565 [Phlegmacium glaucopus]|nr:hypothetical protein BYT27DRAFT_6960565 [Phlegmacium glaucopus]
MTNMPSTFYLIIKQIRFIMALKSYLPNTTSSIPFHYSNNMFLFAIFTIMLDSHFSFVKTALSLIDLGSNQNSSLSSIKTTVGIQHEPEVPPTMLHSVFQSPSFKQLAVGLPLPGRLIFVTTQPSEPSNNSLLFVSTISNIPFNFFSFIFIFIFYFHSSLSLFPSPPPSPTLINSYVFSL